MTNGDNILAVENLGIEMMGFVFYDKSPRYVHIMPSYLPTRCKRVGVFVNSVISNVLKIVSIYNLDYVQLHGEETINYCEELRQKLPKETKIIKCISISSVIDLNKTIQYESIVDYFLFENKCESYGGSGKKFEWDYLSSYQGCKPFLLSGGIGPKDINILMAIHHPSLLGIDLNSRFELLPGIKDIDLLTNFISTIRNEQNQSIIQIKTR